MIVQTTILCIVAGKCDGGTVCHVLLLLFGWFWPSSPPPNCVQVKVQFVPAPTSKPLLMTCHASVFCLVQTTAVFGLALGPHYQTLTMAAFCAFNIVMLLAFEPYKHRQQHRVQLFAFTCIFVMCFAALSFIPSYDGKVPPEPYKVMMGAAVRLL